MERERIRWGILGTGSIAKLFATGLAAVPDAELAAVGSRTAAGAAAFAERFGASRRHAGYAELAADPEVDIVYVAVPHALHHPMARLCLEAGKPVLCEKPFTINTAEAEDLVALARSRGLFLMEAMWTRCLPLMGRVRDLLAQGAIGEPRLVAADFGFRAGDERRGRLFDLALGGGALMDVGVYTVSFAAMVLGAPDRIEALAEIGPTGVDEQTALVFGYPGGQLAQLTSAIRTATPHEAAIIGTGGSIRIQAPWWKPTRLTLAVAGEQERDIEAPFPGNGYNEEAAEAMRCLRAGATESAWMPLDETLGVMRTLDAARARLGLRYPTE